ncbi:MAG: hypothetical protein EHM61_14020 [Acidobacteria bacterium]|nr:MAG: hypothetical protein EHM61_14020 [Acidobacteriota bacterium]
MPTTHESGSPGTRLGRAAALSKYGETRNRWALIVGISKYQDPTLELKYADRDANELYALLQTPSAGEFKPQQMLKLINDEATAARLRRALGGFLLEVGRDDLMLVYFACHGSPDPRRPAGSLYLLTYDTDPNEIAGTAVRMDEVQVALREHLSAERVVVIVDACHSAAIGAGTRGPRESAALLNTYLAKMSESRGGIALLTSAEASEASLEDERWGGGHGVFTHFLLEGLKGAADGHSQPRDGIVTVGELFDFVRDKVSEETKSQHPAIGPSSFDRNMPLAITGGEDARTQYELASDLFALAARLDDAGRFEAAARHFAEASQRSRSVGVPLPDADLQKAKSLLAAGEAKAAILSLETLANAPDAPADTWLLLGMARAESHNTSAAREALERFLKLAPDSLDAAWIRDYIRALQEGVGGVRRALIIGINHYPKLPHTELTGCVNDANRMRDVLVGRLGFHPDNVRLMTDDEATGNAIRKALAMLEAESGPADTLVMHFSGHSVPEPGASGAHQVPKASPEQREQETFLITSEVESQANGLHGGVSARELHDLLNAIPARQKFVILDTHANTAFTTLAERGANYSLLLAAYPGKLAYEHTFEYQGVQAPGGLLTGAVLSVLGLADPTHLDYGTLLDETIREIQRLAFDQVPMFVGNRDQLVMSAEDVHLNLWQLSQRYHFHSDLSPALAQRQADLLGRLAVPFPSAWAAVGRAYLSANALPAACEALGRALSEYGDSDARTTLALSEVLFSGQQYAEARRYVTVWSQADEDPADGSALVTTLRQLESGSCHALLIGISRYASEEVPPLNGPANDVKAFRAAIVEQLRCPEENVTMLLDEKATRSAILENFRVLAARAQQEPAMFLFAGYGSLDADAAPTLVPYDGRTEGIFDIPVSELASVAPARDTNLLAVLDCGCTRSSAKDTPRSRYLATDVRSQPGGRQSTGVSRLSQVAQDVGRMADKPVLRTVDAPGLRVGATTIFPGSFRSAFQTDAPLLEGPIKRDAKRGKGGGYLSQALAAALRVKDGLTPSYHAWIERVEQELKQEPVMTSKHPDEPVLANHTLRAVARAAFRRIEHRPFSRLVSLLQNHIARTSLRPEPYLDLGLAFYALGEWNKALQRLRTAVNLYDDPSVFEQESKIDSAVSEHQRQARYHFARVLYEQKKELGKAVEELRKARDQEPEDARVHYYLGQAMRALIERESLAEARKALQTYLDKGAPLGHRDEVRRFVVASKTPG